MKKKILIAGLALLLFILAGVYAWQQISLTKNSQSKNLLKTQPTGTPAEPPIEEIQFETSITAIEVPDVVIKTSSENETDLENQSPERSKLELIEDRVDNPDIMDAPKKITGNLNSANSALAMKALYQALYRRDPDPTTLDKNAEKLSAKNWDDYLSIANDMAASPEFEVDITSQQSAENIIQRVYTVLLGQCPNKFEIDMQLRQIESSGYQALISDVLNRARSTELSKLMNGGFKAKRCSSK